MHSIWFSIVSAARRRFVKRLYIPLPEKAARIDIVRKTIQTVKKHEITNAGTLFFLWEQKKVDACRTILGVRDVFCLPSCSELDVIGEKSDGYSGADMTNGTRGGGEGQIWPQNSRERTRRWKKVEEGGIVPCVLLFGSL